MQLLQRLNLFVAAVLSLGLSFSHLPLIGSVILPCWIIPEHFISSVTTVITMPW